MLACTLLALAPAGAPASAASFALAPDRTFADILNGDAKAMTDTRYDQERMEDTSDGKHMRVDPPLAGLLDAEGHPKFVSHPDAKGTKADLRYTTSAEGAGPTEEELHRYDATQMVGDGSGGGLERFQYGGPASAECRYHVMAGDTLLVHYVGTIDSSSAAGTAGVVFDSSRDRDEPFSFTVGGGRVIQGWDEGLLGLCTKATVRLIVPPAMGYGDAGAGDRIPGGATLNFDVEVPVHACML